MRASMLELLRCRHVLCVFVCAYKTVATEYFVFKSATADEYRCSVVQGEARRNFLVLRGKRTVG